MIWNRFFGAFKAGGGGKSAGHQAAVFAEQYESLRGFNVVAAVSNKLANIVCSEVEISAEAAENTESTGLAPSRMRDIENAVRLFAGDLRGAVSRAFGTGGVVLRPYVYNGAVYTDIVPQERFFVIERYGGNIVKAGFIADMVGDFTRVELHSIAEGSRYIIENKAYDGEREVPLSSIGEWSKIAPRTVLEGVNAPLFAYLRCPVEPRGGNGNENGHGGFYGVPITHGQEWLINAINELLAEIPLEYRNKRAFIGAEDLLFDSRDRLPDSGLYKLLRASGGDNQSFWEVFSPEIRHTSYFEGLNYLFGLLEKAMSVNKGILTDLDTSDATATAIRRSMFDTFNLVDAMRKNIERAMRELVYAYYVLAELENGDGNESGNESGNGAEADLPKLRFVWSYALLEDTAETFAQLLEGYDRGVVTKEELRAFLG